MSTARQEVSTSTPEISPQALILNDCGLSQTTIRPGDSIDFRLRVNNDGTSQATGELIVFNSDGVGFSAQFTFDPGEFIYVIRVPYDSVLSAWGLGNTTVNASFVGVSGSIQCGVLTVAEAATIAGVPAPFARVAGGVALGGIAAPVLIPESR